MVIQLICLAVKQQCDNILTEICDWVPPPVTNPVSSPPSEFYHLNVRYWPRADGDAACLNRPFQQSRPKKVGVYVVSTIGTKRPWV